MTVVQEVRKSLTQRLEDLAPAIEEADEIREALAALGGQTRRKPGRPRGSRKNGNRTQEFVNLVKENPGIKVSEAAQKMGIPPNYLYRVAADLVKKDQIKKDGKRYSVASS